MATLQRIREQAVVILAQDTTELEVTRKHERMDGAGPLSDGSRLGFFDHVVLAMTAEKVVLGVVDAKICGADPEDLQKSAKEKRAARRGKAIEDKESGRWLDGYRQACRVAQEAPETLVVCVSDSEGDVYECFLEGQPAADERKAAWIVRACQNRQVAAAEDASTEPTSPAKLKEQVAATAVLHTMTVEVSRASKR